jgi:hypothetical protein
MTLHATSLSPVSGGTLLDSADGIPLPLDGWQLRHRVPPNGRAVVEIIDDTGDLVGLIMSTNLPMLSVDAAWRGIGQASAGARHWWALAIGHASPDDDDEPVVTFRRRSEPHQRPHRAVVRPVRIRGLWIASAPGLYTTVSCRHGTERTVRRLATHPAFETRRS